MKHHLNLTKGNGLAPLAPDPPAPERSEKLLASRYMEGETTPEEEKQLARLLLDTDCGEDVQELRILLGKLSMDEAEYDLILSQRQAASRRRPLRWVAACACLAVVAGLALHFMGGKENVSLPADSLTEEHQPSLPQPADTSDTQLLTERNDEYAGIRISQDTSRQPMPKVADMHKPAEMKGLEWAGCLLEGYEEVDEAQLVVIEAPASAQQHPQPLYAGQTPDVFDFEKSVGRIKEKGAYLEDMIAFFKNEK